MFRNKILRALTLLGASLAAAPSNAALFDYLEDPEPDFMNNVYLKSGIIYLEPRVKSGPLEFYGLDDTAQLALDEGPYPGTGADVGTELTLALALGYVLPWGDRHWSVETILAPPLEFNLYATGVARTESLAPEAAGIPTGVPPLGKTLGETMMLPPTFTLVYHFFPDAIYRPYVGAGVSYIYTYHEKITNPVLAEVVRPDLEISDEWAWVVQLGLDIDFYRRFFTSLDFKYVSGAEVTAVVEDIRLNSDVQLFDPIRIERSVVTQDLSTVVWQASLGYRF